jgi:biopolymer transport protein ExbD
MINDRGGVSIQSALAGTTPTNLDRLAGDVAKASGATGSRAWIVVSSAPHTRYGAFMAVLDRLHTDGFTEVTLAPNAA